MLRHLQKFSTFSTNFLGKIAMSIRQFRNFNQRYLSLLQELYKMEYLMVKRSWLNLWLVGRISGRKTMLRKRNSVSCITKLWLRFKWLILWQLLRCSRKSKQTAKINDFMLKIIYLKVTFLFKSIIKN